jgi:signal transduction histidine kinase
MPPQPGASGIGLIAMRERAGMLRGSISFSTPPEGGTRVTVTIPLNGGESP